jgi:SAM-dependent methyltransferase
MTVARLSAAGILVAADTCRAAERILCMHHLVRGGRLAAYYVRRVWMTARRRAVTMVRSARRVGRLVRLQQGKPALCWWRGVDDESEFINRAYWAVLGRESDPGGVAHFLEQRANGWGRVDVLRALARSAEAVSGPGLRRAEEAFHQSRATWIRSLPPARRILDLGGTCLGDDRGALVAMGYRHPFDDLLIVELPPDQRHELYRLPENRQVRTHLGPVRYLYRSMTELADLPDASFDLICSAQTFEHIPPADGVAVLNDVRRLLAPGGALALDTPNAAVSSIQAREAGSRFINPDHKIEYTHRQMLDLFAGAGLDVVRQHGIGFMPATVASAHFVPDELAEHPGLFADLERCYTLAYLAARTPVAAAP